MRTGSKFNSIHLCEYFFWIKRLAVKGWGCDDPAIFQKENTKKKPPFKNNFNRGLLFGVLFLKARWVVAPPVLNGELFNPP
jgi:hypothetical protein